MPPYPAPHKLHSAAAALRCGGVVACPTEAVWGLSCDPFNREAVQHLLSLKRRPAAKGLILVAGAMQQLDFLLFDLPAAQRARLSDSWPGPNTWLISHHGRVPAVVCGTHDKVAVRVSAHPVVRALCEEFGGPLVSTSANRAGARPALQAFQVHRYFGDGLDYLLSGSLGGAGRPSTIRDLDSGEILRD